MTKKLVSLLLLALLVCSLAACSPEEIGYLDMYYSSAENLKQATDDSTLRFTIRQTEYGPFGDLPFSTIDLKLKSSMDITDPQNFYVLVDMALSLDGGADRPFGRLLMRDGQMYADIAYFRGIFNLTFELMAEYDPVGLDSAEIQVLNQVFDELESEDYWISLLPDFAGDMAGYYTDPFTGTFMANYTSNMQAMMALAQDPDLLQGSKDFLLNAFAGFDTRTVSQIDGGYRISFDAAALGDLFLRLLDYVAANTDRVFDATAALLDTIESSLAEQTPELAADAAEGFAMMQEYLANELLRQTAREELTALAAEIRESGLLEELPALAGGSHFTMDMTQEGGGYNVRCDMQMEIPTENVGFGMSMDSQTRPAAVSRIPAPAKVIGMAEVTERLEDRGYQLNPVNAVLISLDEPEYGYADLTLIRGLGDEPSFSEISMDQGVLSMPVSELCGIFNEDFTVDEVTRQLFLVRDFRVPVNFQPRGFNDFLMPVREMTKLGYSVRYFPETADTVAHVVVTRDGQAPYDASGHEALAKIAS